MKTRPNIVFVSETHLTNNIEDCEVQLKNYNCVRCDSISRHTGGVLIYVRECIDFYLYYSDVLNSINTWFLSLKVLKGMKQGLYSVLYHSPNSNNSDFLEFFENIVENVLNIEEKNILVGDFNINLNNKNGSSEKLKSIITLSGMKQFVKEATRVTNSSSTLIDLVVSNVYDLKIRIVDSFIY